MTVAQVLTLVGVPSLSAAFVLFVIKRLQQNRTDSNVLKVAIQALLRNQLIEMYEHYREKGYAPIYARQNFENMYTQYHALGVNGVMDDIRAKFLALPDKRKEQQEEKNHD